MRSRRRDRGVTLRSRLSLFVAAVTLICTTALAVFINAGTLLLLRSIKAPPPRGIPAETWHLLNQVRVDSLLGLGLVAVLGWVGSYWVAGRALRPLREVSRAALEIDTDTLDKRLALRGPRDELTEMADRFDAMLDRLQTAFVREQEFVADASHELRTPLSAARANLEVVHLDPSSSLDDYREMADMLDSALVRLERLVTNLLILASGDALSPVKEVFLVPLVEDILADVHSVASTLGVHVSYVATEQLIVSGDPELLRRAFKNLIENAVHYNRPNGTVVVGMLKLDARVVVEVADTGIGMPSTDLPHIFERFYRIEQSRSRHLGGAGLGLALACEIVRRHGGEILVESQVGSGTTFRVLLPA